MARAALIALLACGCLGSEAAECPGGGLCPQGLVCRLDRGEQTCVIASCGDGVVDGAEGCDDGNNDSGDTCPGDCVATTSCGDGDIDFGEDCDDGNRVAGDGCSPTCRFPTRPAPRSEMAMAYDVSRDVLVVFGGWGTTIYGDTWEWNGTEWFERHPVDPVPSRRADAAMTYDPVRQRVIMFGGRDLSGTVSDVMWEWDGTSWNELHPATAPSMRYAAAMTFDTTRGVAALFGGETQSGASNELWEWHDSTWELKQTAGPPRPLARTSAAMSFDESEGTMLLIGGAGSFDDDRTWRWNGATWSDFVVTGAPGDYSDAGMAYDRERHVSVHVGGSAPTSFAGTDHMFELAGQSWSDRSDVSGHPSPRRGPGVAYVDSIHAVVVFGGFGPPDPEETPLDDLWSWDGTTWREHL